MRGACLMCGTYTGDNSDFCSEECNEKAYEDDKTEHELDIKLEDNES